MSSSSHATGSTPEPIPEGERPLASASAEHVATTSPAGSPTDEYAVVGYPVQHSKSPFIHAMFAAQTDQAMRYQRLEVAPDDFEAAIVGFFERGGKGLNITVPHKEVAWRLAARHAPNAALAGAVNTLYREDGELVGDNTDGVGMVRDIEQNNGGQLSGARIVILGAGGAVRGVIPRLLNARPDSITIVNRTVS